MPAPTTTTKMQVLEINLISAQGLKPPSSTLRRTQTYALTWVHPTTKLRTRVDKLGGENPTWNDKFLFRVTPEFLASETSAVSVAIYAVGTIRDTLIGTGRLLVSNILSSFGDNDGDSIGTPSFSAFQIRRPSGRFHGVLNIGAVVLDASEIPALNEISAIGYRDLMGEKVHRGVGRSESHRRKSTSKNGDEPASSESCENSCTDSVDLSDSTESSTSSSSTPKAALQDWNGVRKLAGTKSLKASGFLCCLLTQRKGHLSPTDPKMSSGTHDVES